MNMNSENNKIYTIKIKVKKNKKNKKLKVLKNRLLLS